MRLDEIEWEYQGNSVRVGMTWHGEGPSVLMLPALSSISTRSEMWPPQERLGSRFTTLAIDWVGFGDRPRPPLRGPIASSVKAVANRDQRATEAA